MPIALQDSRRLTGLNIAWQHPGAVVDVSLDEDTAYRVSSGVGAIWTLLRGTVPAVGIAARHERAEHSSETGKRDRCLRQ